MGEYDSFARQEQSVLKLSIGFTLLLSAGGILTGVITGSSSIIFDGMYSAIDSIFSVAALLVARLIYLDANRYSMETPRFTRRFHHGFWHLEPMLLALNGISLTIAVCYGFFEAISSILAGGHTPEFGPAVKFSSIAIVLCVGMAVYETKRNKTIESDFIAVDIKSWIVSAGISLALLLAFIFADLITDTPYAGLLPFIDPVVLATIACIMFPMPLKIVFNAVQEILLITPVELDEKIRAVTDMIVERHNFSDCYYYLAKVGRSTMIEIHLVLPQHYNIGDIEFLDKVREEIGREIGEESPDRWLTVSFTGDEKWAI